MCWKWSFICIIVRIVIKKKTLETQGHRKIKIVRQLQSKSMNENIQCKVSIWRICDKSFYATLSILILQYFEYWDYHLLYQISFCLDASSKKLLFVSERSTRLCHSIQLSQTAMILHLALLDQVPYILFR